MAGYAFIQNDDQGVEQVRVCATDASPQMRLQSGDLKSPSAIVVGDKIKTGGFTLRVDLIVTT